MSNKQEDTKLLEYCLENTFYKAWRTDVATKKSNYLGNYNNLELMVNQKCHLSCKYCYMNKYASEYFPGKSQDSKTILYNTDLLIEWLHTNQYHPVLEVFAGDSVGDPTCRKIIHKVLDAALQGKIVAEAISAPTNFSWIRNAKQTEDVRTILEKSEYASIPVQLSASIDGKFLDDHNRPLKSSSKKYDDEFYDKVFSFVSSVPGTGLHPMVYSNKIERWIDNFLWFQEKMAEYNLPWSSLYLLEVRNVEWTLQQTKDYYKFIKFIIHWAWDKCGSNFTSFSEFLRKGRGFNILSFPFGKVGRGIGCSIQSTMTVRIGDLSIVPCHRLAYKHFDSGKFVVDDDRIVGIEADNLELWLAIQSLQNTASPYCERCILTDMCSGGCLGSQYEVTGDMFTPIPTVCRLFYTKLGAVVDAYKELGIYAGLLGLCNKKDGEKIKAFAEKMEETYELR